MSLSASLFVSGGSGSFASAVTVSFSPVATVGAPSGRLVWPRGGWLGLGAITALTLNAPFSPHKQHNCLAVEHATGMLRLAATNKAAMATFVEGLKELLRTRAHRTLLTTAENAALSSPVPTPLIAGAEAGAEVTLHSRTEDGEFLSEPAHLWFNFQKNSVFWSVGPAATAAAYTEDVVHGLSLDDLSDLYDGMHDSIWADGSFAGATDATALTIVGAQQDNPNEDGFPTPIELHIQTATPEAQQMLLETIQYTSDAAELAPTDEIKAVVVVHMAPQQAQAPAPVAAAAAPAPAPAPAAVAVSLEPFQATDPDLSTDPIMQILVAGLPVTVVALANPADPASLHVFEAQLAYVHERGQAKITWTALDNSASGAALFADMTDVFLGQHDDAFKDPACAAFDHDACLSIYTEAAIVDGVKVAGWRLHLATATTSERTVFLDAVQHGLTHMGAAVDNVTAPTPPPVAKKPSKLRAPSVDLTIAVAEATAFNAAAASAATSRAPTPLASPKSSASSSATATNLSASSRLLDLSQPKPKLPPPPPVVYQPMPIVPPAPAPKMSLKTVAKLASLSQPRKKVDVAEEERQAKAIEVEQSKRAILAAAAAEKRRSGVGATPVKTRIIEPTATPVATPAKTRTSIAPAAAAELASASKKKVARSSLAPAPAPTPVRSVSTKSRASMGPVATPAKKAPAPEPVVVATPAKKVVAPVTMATKTRKSVAPTPAAAVAKPTRASLAPPTVVAAPVAVAAKPVSPKKTAAQLMPAPSPMPVSSPAQAFTSATPAPTSDSPALALYEGEQGLLDDPMEEAAPAEPEEDVYDPEKDNDLEFDMDFDSPAKPPAPVVKPTPQKAESPAPEVVEEALVTPQKAAEPVANTLPATPAPAAFVAAASTPQKKDEPMAVMAALSPMKPSTPAVPTPKAKAKAATPKAAKVPTPKPRKTRVSMFGEELDDEFPDEDDDLDDLFGTGDQTTMDEDDQPVEDEPEAETEEQEEVVEEQVEEVVEEQEVVEEEEEVEEEDPEVDADALLALVDGTTPPPAREESESEVSSSRRHAVTSSVDLPMPIAMPDFELAAPAPAEPEPAAPIIAVAAPISATVPLQRALSAYQLALLRLEQGLPFTSYTSGPNGAPKAERIFLWFNPHPVPLASMEGEPSTGALFWCALAFPRGSVQQRWESNERRVDIAHLADIYSGRQYGLLMREEFEGTNDDLCISLVAAEEPNGPPTQELDLVAEDASQLAEFMDAFNTMLQGPQEEDEFAEQGLLDDSVPVAAAAPKKPSRTSVPFLSDGAQSSPLLPVHMSSAPIEPHTSRLLQLADVWDAQTTEDNVRTGQHALKAMRHGATVQIFLSDALQEGSFVQTRHYIAWQPAVSAFDAQGQPFDQADSTDIGKIGCSSLRANDQATDRTIDPRQVKEVVLGKFAGVFEAAATVADSSDVGRAISCADHARCLSLLLQDGSSVDMEFDSVRHLLTFVLGLKYLLMYVSQPEHLSLDTPLSGLPVPRVFDHLVDEVESKRLETNLSATVTQRRTFTLPSHVRFVELAASEEDENQLLAQPLHIFFSFADPSVDGPFGSLYWNVGEVALDGPIVKSMHRRIDLLDLRAVRTGADEGTFFQRHAFSLASLPTDQCLTLYAKDDLVRWCCVDGANEFARWLEAIQQALAFAGRSLVAEENTQQRWLHVIGGTDVEEEPIAETIVAPLAPQTPVASIFTPAVNDIPMLASIAASFPEKTQVVDTEPLQTFVPPALTPEYLSAVDLLACGRSFYAYSYSSASLTSSEPVVERRQVQVFFSSATPDAIDWRSYDLPRGETTFPALYAIEYTGSTPPARLEAQHMQPGTCLSMHALSDLYLGLHNPIWAAPSTVEQFLTDGRTFVEEACLSIVASASGSRPGEEWSLEAMDESGLDQWLDALNLMLPLHLDEEEMAAQEASPAAPTAANEVAIESTQEPLGNALVFPASPTAASLLQPNSTLQFVLETMRAKQHAADTQLHTTGVSLLHAHASRAIESSPEATSDFITLGVAIQTVESMLAFPRVEALQSVGCGLLWLLAGTSENEASLTQAGAITAALTALQNHVTSIETVHAAAGALRSLSVATANADAIGDAQGLEILMAAMKTHGTNPSIQHQALGALASLLLNANNKTQFASLGGIDLVVALVKRFDAEAPSTQDPTEVDALAAASADGCACLRSLGANNVTNKGLIAAAGGLEVLLQSLRTWLPRASNQLQGVGASWNLTANNAANKQLLTRLGGIETLLATLHAHSADEEIVGEVIGTWRNCASRPEAKAQLSSSQVLTAVVGAMRRFPLATLVNEQAAAFLFNLLSESDETAAAIVAVGGVTALLAAGETFVENAAIIEELCGSLWMATRVPQSFDVVSPPAVVALAERALALHPNHPAILNFASGMAKAWGPQPQQVADENGVAPL